MRACVVVPRPPLGTLVSALTISTSLYTSDLYIDINRFDRVHNEEFFPLSLCLTLSDDSVALELLQLMTEMVL